ncbi:serine/threonine-protein kinase [Nannocystis radixulma]|uniref:Protein kinase n=1 Tax=Nannocystis radixulma TaxID=2995305 RepID=A0ABT5BK48_9BACT|nr:serine/threonine-protein kinase [Nannocystis radixulma]MDC0674487.1 protein kinase [Nannocystis radixulma]
MAVHGGDSPEAKAGDARGGAAARGDVGFAATVDSDTIDTVDSETVDGPSAGMSIGSSGRARLPAHLDSTASHDAANVFVASAMPMNIGRHVLVRPLGMGGMGQVFEARAPDGTTVALKIIRGTSPERLYRFKREFRSLSAVVHPNIVALYDLVHVDDQHGAGLAFFTMELLRGAHFVSAVRDELPDGEGLDEAGLRRLQDCMVGLACGLSCVHRHGLVHRDIKPSNVMVTASGRVVVLDLGLVRESRVASFDNVGENAALLGTPLYMAPEQIVRSDDAGPPADWYAVGEVLWECLSGESRHTGRPLVEVFERKLMEVPEAPSRRRPGVPQHLDRLCIDLLAREPEDRPTAAEVLTRLGRGDLVAIELTIQGLLGREQEARLLRDHIVQPGRTSAVFVSGPSGFGKTTLVEHVLDVARREDGIVAFSGSCSERESIPFKALDSAIDALGLYLCSSDAGDATAIGRREDLAALARLFPVLRTVPAIRAIDDARLDGCDPIEIRRRAADSLAELLTRIAIRRQVVLALDDLQWADLDSVLLLESVLLRKHPPPVALLGSHREGTEATRAPLAHLWGSLEASEQVALRRVVVGPLSEEQSIALAARLLGGPVDDPVAARVAREARGSPFFIGELVRYALAHGGLDDAGLSLDGLLRTHLQRLPPSAKRLVEVLAVAGGRLPRTLAVDIVTAAAGPVDRGTLARLRAEHLIRIADSSQDDVLETYHDRVREAAAQEAAESHGSELAAIHRAIGEALLRSGSADTATLAHHFRAANDTERATRFTLAAAEDAARALAFDQAAELFRATLSIGGIDAAAATHTRARLAEALANAGRLHAAARVYTDAAHAGDGAASEAQRTEWLRLAAAHFLSTGHHDEGRAVLEELLPRVGLSLTRGTASTIVALLGQRALLAARKLELPSAGANQLSERDAQRLDVCWTVTRGLIYSDGIASALFHARHLRLALNSGDPLRAARAIGYEAYVRALMEGGTADAQATAIFDSLEASADVQSSPYVRGMLAQYRAGAHQMLCRFEQALVDYERGIAILREQCTGVMDEIAQMDAHRMTVLMYLGRIGELSDVGFRLLRECAERPNPYVEGFARGVLGNYVYLAQDQVDAATEQLEHYRRHAPKRFEAHFFNCASKQTELLRYRGDAEGAWKQNEIDSPLVEKLLFFRVPFVKAEFHRSRAANALALAAQTSDPAPLLKIARAAARHNFRVPLPMSDAYGHLTLASVAALEGKTELAVSELRRTVAIFERLSMGTDLAASRRRLAALVGGDEGRAHQQKADAWMSESRIARPDRFTDMVAPGFVRRT